jgi:hypothetical protein
MDYTLFEKALVDFFCRQHHDIEVARSRAAAVVRIAQGCDEEIVGGDRGFELTCPVLQIVPLIDECDVALRTLDAFLEEKGQS